MEKLGVPCLAMYPEEEDVQFYMETKKTPLEEFFQNKYFERGSLSCLLYTSDAADEL